MRNLFCCAFFFSKLEERFSQNGFMCVVALLVVIILFTADYSEISLFKC